MADLRREGRLTNANEMQEKRNAFRRKMKESVTATANTPGGLNLLRFLLMESGFVSPLHTVDSQGRLDKESLAWNVSRRQMYLDVRQFMTPEVIRLVELGGLDEQVQKEEGGER